MPPRFVTALIIAGWMAVTAWFVSESLWPRWFPSGAPFKVDLDVELAAQLPPVRWEVLWHDKPIGQLRSGVRYRKEDDTFEWYSTFIDLTLGIPRNSPAVTLTLRNWTNSTRTSREGVLRELTAEGKAGAKVNLLGIIKEEIEGDGGLKARTENGLLVGRTEFRTNRGTFSEALVPTVVKPGSMINPLMPLDKIPDLRAGAPSWQVVLHDPLGTAVQATARKLVQGNPLAERLLPASAPTTRTLLARVGSETKPLTWAGGTDPCLVIEYRDDRDEAVARTWVHAEDGRVLLQEAFVGGETLQIRRLN